MSTCVNVPATALRLFPPGARRGPLRRLRRSLFFVRGSFGDARAYSQLKARLDAIDLQFGIPGSRVFYLAVPPQLVGLCVEHLRDAGMVHDPDDLTSFTRVIVEKPIGRDLESARTVIKAVDQAFAENQTYRIDHYLGKETVQNLLVLRFANSIFEPLWNQKYIDHVQITVAEEEGVAQWDPDNGAMTASRVGYYEGVGACATCCRTTCCKCSASSAWNRHTPSLRTWSATPRRPCCAACVR